MSVYRQLARKMGELGERQIEERVSDLDYAVVKSTAPLSALHESGMLLDEDDLIMGYSARKFDKDVGLEVGDTLVVKLKASTNDWVVVDVVSDKDII